MDLQPVIYAGIAVLGAQALGIDVLGLFEEVGDHPILVVAAVVAGAYALGIDLFGIIGDRLADWLANAVSPF